MAPVSRPPPIAVAPPPAPEPRELPVALGDLADMKKRGVLRVLVERAEEDFLPRQGMPREQDRILLERFAQRHGLEAEFIVVERFDALLPWLREGRADLGTKNGPYRTGL